MNPRITIGNIEIPTFNICVILGITIALLLFVEIEKQKISACDMDNLIALLGVAIPISFFCAFLFNKIFVKSVDSVNTLLRYEGMTFFGGFLGGIFFFLLIHRFIVFKNRVMLKEHLNVLTPYFVLAHCFGRLGCFFAGCCYGKPTKTIIGVKFCHGTPAFEQYGDIKILPVQMIEAVALLMLCVGLFKIQEKYRFAVYLLSYGSLRFILELFRGDYRGELFYCFSPSQIICIFLVGISFVILVCEYDRNEKGKENVLS